jgi:hypothetical protein
MDQPKTVRLVARVAKAAIVVEPASLVGLEVPVGTGHVPFALRVGGRVVRGQFNAKTLRRAVAALDGGAAATVVVQGKLAGDRLEEAGIVATPRDAAG